MDFKSPENLRLEEYRYVKAALRRAKRYGLHQEFGDCYRRFRKNGDSPVVAAFDALYEWDMLDPFVKGDKIGVHLDMEKI